MNPRKRCAACKFLRRRCPKDCIFSPYFPPNDPQKSACIHRIFGAGNFSKMLQQIPDQKNELKLWNLCALKQNAELKILFMAVLGLLIYCKLNPENSGSVSQNSS